MTRKADNTVGLVWSGLDKSVFLHPFCQHLYSVY